MNYFLLMSEMNIRNFALNYLALPVLLASFLVSCTDQKDMIEGSGVLKGKISIGPLCPVESIPPDPGCLPTAETYKAWAVDVWSSDKRTKVTTLDPKLDGNYLITLPAGNYMVDFDVVKNNSIGRSNLPVLITVNKGDTTNLNIDIDTGIR